MESPLKERLTGALIVVAVLVIVVPEMLSGPDKAPATSRAAGDAGPPVRTFTLELGTPAAARTQDQSSLTPQSSEPPVVAAVTVPAASAPAVVAPEPAPAPKDAQPSVVPPASAPAPASTPAPPVALPSPAPADVKPVATVPSAAPAPGAKGQWWTQLGSFSARDNAERLARDLHGKGYVVNVAKIRVGGKDLYRVRSGPVASREAAVALQARLAAAGHKSSLVAP